MGADKSYQGNGRGCDSGGRGGQAAAVLAVQTHAKADLAVSLLRETSAKTDLAHANADLTRSQAAVQARYD
jgi:hypothetical protein